MNAREFLLTDPKIQEAVSNGYDIRLEEHEWIEKMELYALTKQNSHKHSVMQGLPTEHEIHEQALLMENPNDGYATKIIARAAYESGARWAISKLSSSPTVGDGAAGQNVSGGHIHYHVHAGSMQKCVICGEINDLDCG